MFKFWKYLKRIVLISIGLYGIILSIALWAQQNIHSQFNESFNPERMALGVYPIEGFKTDSSKYWKDYLPYHPFSQWSHILSNVEIANSTTYTNSGEGKKPYHKSKEVFFGTQLCFWQNFYGAEVDVFIKPLDSNSHVELVVTYYSKYMMPANTFYPNVDTIYNNLELMICGTTDFDPEDPEYYLPKSNISKEQADTLLMNWGLK